MGIIRTSVEDDGLAMVVIDDPARPVNTLTPEFLVELEDEILPLAQDPAVKGMVLISAKPDSFIAGADIKLFAQTTDGALVAEADGRYSRALTRLNTCGKPVVAAVHGPALGGGLEVALACHYIMASSSPATVLGLPEVTLGILPAAGGTQRLPRRVGLVRGMNLMLTGRRVRAAQALAMGLVDEVVAPGALAEAAAERARGFMAGRPLPAPYRPTWQERIISLPILRGIFFKKVRAATAERTKGNYPGPLKIIDCVETGLKQGMQAALDLEIASIGELFETPVCRNLIWLFNAGGELRAQRDSAQARLIRQLGVVGAGTMGGGIASVSLGLCPVKVVDREQEALDRCRNLLARGMDKMTASGSLSTAERERREGRLALSLDRFSLAGSDLVVEAVPEDLGLKQRVLAQAEEVISPEAVYASGTSALPIAAIASQARHPERVLGMHYFSPVPSMMLMELVAPDGAADWALATARAFASSQGKTVIVVADRPGFYTTRILTAYLNEAVRLMQDGLAIDDLDQALTRFGFAVGPAALMDLIGLATVARVSQDLGDAYSARWGAPPPGLKALAGAGLDGKRHGAGFYLYPEGAGKPPQPDPKAGQILAAAGGGTPLPARDPAERCALAMANEAAWCLADGVIASPRDGELGAVLGVSFPAFRGGPFHYLDSLGAGAAVSRLEDLAASQGGRFSPAPTLVDLARRGGSFF